MAEDPFVHEAECPFCHAKFFCKLPKDILSLLAIPCPDQEDYIHIGNNCVKREDYID